MSRRLTIDITSDRDPHRSFVVQLAQELISGKSIEAPSDSSVFFSVRGEEGLRLQFRIQICETVSRRNLLLYQNVCVALNSKQLSERSKAKAWCVNGKVDSSLLLLIIAHFIMSVYVSVRSFTQRHRSRTSANSQSGLAGKNTTRFTWLKIFSLLKAIWATFLHSSSNEGKPKAAQ